MSRAYWDQWDKSDLDSWQGKDCEPEDDDPDCDVEKDEDNEEEGCSCGYYCMDCLGMSWRDFM